MVEEKMRRKILSSILIVLFFLSISLALGIPNTIAKDESSKEPKFRRSDNPILHLPVDEENWIPIVPPEPVGRPLDEDAEQYIELLIYDVETKETKRILKDFTKSDKTTLKLPGSQGSLPSELITGSPIGWGDRVRVTPTIDPPWRTICKLRMWFPNDQQYMGSGFIIDNYHILTAGHCVVYNGEWAYAIEVVPALDGGAMPFYHAWATSMTVNSNWLNYDSYQDDFAIITLDRNIGDLLGWMGLITADPSDSIYTDIVNTAGYPGDLDDGWNMYRDSDWGDGADDSNHWYYMDTRGGQSGSPVWYYSEPDRYVLSIVAYETIPPEAPNFGTRLSQYWFDLIDLVREGDTPPTDYANLIDDGQDWSGFSTTQVVPGVTPFSVWSDIVNIGTAESGIFQVSYYASTDNVITASDHLIGTVSIPSIQPFYYRDSDWSGTFPSGIPGGTYYVGWIIDSTDVVPEPLDFGEDNNVAYKDSYQLTVESIVVSINVVETTIDFNPIGEEGLVRDRDAHIENTGNVPVSVSASLEVGSNPLYTEGLTIVTVPVPIDPINIPVLDLPLGQTLPVTLTLTIPTTQQAGTFTGTIIFWAETN